MAHLARLGDPGLELLAAGRRWNPEAAPPSSPSSHRLAGQRRAPSRQALSVPTPSARSTRRTRRPTSRRLAATFPRFRDLGHPSRPRLALWTTRTCTNTLAHPRRPPPDPSHPAPDLVHLPGHLPPRSPPRRRTTHHGRHRHLRPRRRHHQPPGAHEQLPQPGHPALAHLDAPCTAPDPAAHLAQRRRPVPRGDPHRARPRARALLVGDEARRARPQAVRPQGRRPEECVVLLPLPRPPPAREPSC